MINCSRAENFLKEQSRMCIKYRSYPNACRGCPLSCWNNKSPKGDLITCCDILSENPQKAIEIVQKWSNKHPQKTFLTDFLEKYPNTSLTNGIPSSLCPHCFGYMTKEEFFQCSKNCQDCWNTPIED